MAAYSDRGTAVYVAKMAVESERYDDAVEAMKSVALMGVGLTSEEMNVLEVAYKNAIGSRRSSRRILSTMRQREESERNELNVERIIDYIRKVETEIIDICIGAKSLLDGHVIPASTSNENKVVCFKMIGDHLRYRAELKDLDHPEWRQLADESLLAYEMATAIAYTELPISNRVRLNLAANFSIFCYGILNLPERAREIAQRAHDGAMAEIDTLNGEAREEIRWIAQTIMNNLTLWAAAEANAANNDENSSSSDGSEAVNSSGSDGGEAANSSSDGGEAANSSSDGDEAANSSSDGDEAANSSSSSSNGSHDGGIMILDAVQPR